MLTAETGSSFRLPAELRTSLKDRRYSEEEGEQQDGTVTQKEDGKGAGESGLKPSVCPNVSFEFEVMGGIQTG